MAKLTLNPVQSGFYSTALLNQNFSDIEAAIENTLSRDGTIPNSMTASLDLNSNDILNVDRIDATSLVLGGELVLAKEPLFTAVSASQVSYLPPGDGAVISDVQTELQDVQTELQDVQTKLQETISVKDFGAEGDGVADDTAAIQAAINAANEAGGGTVLFMPVTYLAKNISMKNNVKLLGVRGKTILKVPAGFDSQILSNTSQSTGVSVDYFSVEGIIFDGNKTASPRTVATSAVGANIMTFFHGRDCIFRNASGYGLAMQGQPGYTSVAGPQLDVYLENCYFVDNGDGATGGSDTYDGLDVKTCRRMTLINCHASGNSDQGINIRGYNVTIVGGSSYNNGSNGYGFSDNPNGYTSETNITVLGAESYGNLVGFSIAQTTAESTIPVRVSLCGVRGYTNTYGIASGNYNTFCELTVSDSSFYNNNSHGIYVGGAMKRCSITNCTLNGNTGSGAATNTTNLYLTSCELSDNVRYGFEELGTGSRSVISGSTKFLNNTLGSIRLSTNKRLTVGDAVRDYDSGTGDAIASASTVTLPNSGSWFAITGTTGITSITASWRGRVVVLQFSGILTVTDGENLALAGSYTTSSADTLTLVCDGTSWIEVSRSAN